MTQRSRALHSSGSPSGSPNSARRKRSRGPVRIASTVPSLVLDLHREVDAVVDPLRGARVLVLQVGPLEELGAGAFFPGLVGGDRERLFAFSHLRTGLQRVVRLLALRGSDHRVEQPQRVVLIV